MADNKQVRFIVALMLLLAFRDSVRADDAAKLAPPKLAVPEGWRTEDTSYPPPWAKTLPWKGSLQLRFPPGFFKQGDDYFWSYPIFYWLEGDVLSGKRDLERALRAYDAGLYGEQFAADRIKLEFTKEATRKGKFTVLERSVTFHGFDPFVSKQPQTTFLDVSRWYCQKSDRTGVLILRSPRKFDPNDAVWTTLLSFRKQIACPQ